MWKRSIRHSQLLARSRSSRIQPCSRTVRDHPWARALESQSIVVRHAWNWTKIKPDPKNPFFAKRSTNNSPQTAVILMRNADIPMLQIRPPVFMPATSEQVQHTLNIHLFMSDFNIEPRPLAFNALACSSTGLIHYIQIANQHLSLILPTYNITNGGRSPELIPTLLKTFLESAAYTKIGFGAYEDTLRIQDQYGITCKNILDTHWMAKVMGVGSANVGMLHDVFSDVHDVYIPGSISQLKNKGTPRAKAGAGAGSESEQLIDPRRWDWESHGNIELDRELVRCIAQDAFVTLSMYDNIINKKFKHGYQPPWTDPRQAALLARDFLLTSLPRGTLLPVRSIQHLLKGPFMSPDINMIDRDARALALVKHLIDQQDLNSDKADTTPFTFRDPSVLGRLVALPGVRSSEAILANHQSKKTLAAAFGCRIDELRLMQDSDMARKPDKIQDLECFLGVYDWLEFLPGAELDRIPARSVARDGSAVAGGRKEATLVALFLNFGTVAARHKEQPARTKQWVLQRIERLIQQGALLRDDGVIRIEPRFLRQLKRIERQEDRQRVVENKALMAN
ncbi:hypothetical protein BGZ74_008817 [Mortierella antarctica]|nr:hypothetical protein BGZ74_008817 [Mortierella antarctica]